MEPGQVGRRVRELREARGWSLRQLASRAGVSHSYVDFLEKGQRTRVDLGLARKLADALEVPLYELVGEAGAGEGGGGYEGGEFEDALAVNLKRIGEIHRELGPESLRQLGTVIAAIREEAEREWREEKERGGGKGGGA